MRKTTSVYIIHALRSLKGGYPKMKKTSKKLISILLAAVMLSWLLSFNSFAAEDKQAYAAEDASADEAIRNAEVEAGSADEVNTDGGTPVVFSGSVEEPEAFERPITVQDTVRDGGAEIASWTDLQTMLDNASDGDTITLTGNLTAESGNKMLSFPTGINITLDLGGFTLNQNRTSPYDNGHVIYVPVGATATVKGGTLTGGYANNGGGVNNKGTLTLENVTITGNHATDNGGGRGSGIYNSGTLTISGGNINSNSGDDAGGIYNDTSGTVTLLNDAVIQGNESTKHGGGGIVNYGTVNLEKCTITGNTALTNGGGVWNNGTLKVQDKVVIRDNTASGNTGNLYLKSGKVITVTGALSSDTEIHVSGEAFPATVTSGWPGGQDLSVIEFDIAGMTPILSDDEVGMTTTYVERSWNGSQVVAETKPVNEALRPFTTAGITSGEHWYAVCQNTTLSDRISVPAGYTVNLVLMDGVTLTCSKGINESGVFNIYGQAGDSGTLIANGGEYQAGIGGNPGYENGHVNIYGGIVRATGGDYGAGIGTGDEAGTNNKNPQVNIYGGSVTANGGKEAAGIGGGNESGSGKIHIYGGTVTANGGENYGAGIGAGDEGACEEIIIDGGIVNATGGKSAAGIGGSCDTSAGNVVINGGTVTAQGGKWGPGIGSGQGSAAIGSITINGGTVKATGGLYGAGIGSAYDKSVTSGTIKITNGTVEANGGASSAGIGGGNGGNLNAAIVISGGKVTATASKDITRYPGAAGIGSGAYDMGGGDFKGTITISGGEVRAYASGYWEQHEDKYLGAAGIGGGSKGILSGTVNISGGWVEAISVFGGAAIGSGPFCSNEGGDCTGTVNITGGKLQLMITNQQNPIIDETGVIGQGRGGHNSYGTLNLPDNYRVWLGDSEPVTAANRKTTCQGHSKDIYLYIEPCEPHNVTSYTITEETHTAHCKYCKNAVAEAHDYLNGECTVCGYKTDDPFCKVQLLPYEGGTGDIIEFGLLPGTDYTLPECPFTPKRGYQFAAWIIIEGGTDPVAKMPGETIHITANLTNIIAAYDGIPAFKGHAVLLSGQIGLQFFLELPEDTTSADYPDSYVTFTGNKIDSSVQYPLPSETAVINGEDTGRYLFTISLSSIQMADEIRPVFHYTDIGETETKTVMGESYSVEEYINWALDNTADSDLAIVKALADYGYYAQQYLSVQNGWTIGKDYGEMTTHVTKSYDYDVVTAESEQFAVVKGTNDNIKKVSYKLQFASEIALRVTMTPAAGVTIDTVTVNGEPVEPTMAGKSCYVECKGIKAKRLTETYIIAAEGGETKVSPMSYVYGILTTAGTSDEAKNLVCALYYYAQACL